MKKSYRFLGKERRITLPDELCLGEDWKQGTLVSFERLDERTMVIRKEKICNQCGMNQENLKEVSLENLLNNLSRTEQRAALKYLLKNWAESEEL